jgi:transketolase
VDVNGQQALGYTEDILSLAPMFKRFKAFDWDVVEVDGHDTYAMFDAVMAPRSGKPRVLLCRTVFGKGVSFMERQIRWHYMPMSEVDFAMAIAELGASECG